MREKTQELENMADTDVPVTDTETRAITDKPVAARVALCPDCGNGWTFDFAQRRVYCRTCEEIKNVLAHE